LSAKCEGRIPQNAETWFHTARRSGSLAAVNEPALVFAAPKREEPALELRVNFGVFAGREATQAEIEALGKELLEKAKHVTIVSERHHEIGYEAESSVHQLRIEVPAEALPLWECDVPEMRGRLIEVTERWALGCIADRSQSVSASAA
jgi:hypothetical protein